MRKGEGSPKYDNTKAQIQPTSVDQQHRSVLYVLHRDVVVSQLCVRSVCVSPQVPGMHVYGVVTCDRSHA